jgi:cobalt-zinc-cadmium efflux system membrane fusion protein
MAGEHLRTFLRHLGRVLGPEGGVSDAQLLQRFASQRDEAAFEVLVWRHAGRVLDVCARWVRQAEDTEDVFQATFLTLARKAASVARGDSLGNWLATVAQRVVLRLHARTGREVAAPPDGLDPPAPSFPDAAVTSDLRPVLDEEIGRLPEKYRVPVVLCYLEGKTTQEAARQLGCPQGTVCSRLSWARRRLRDRLTRRGLALSTLGLAVTLPRTASAALVGATVKAAMVFSAGQGAAGVLSGRAVALAEGVLRTMLLAKVKMTAAIVLLVGTLGLGVGLSRPRAAVEKPPAEAPVLIRGSGDGVRLPPEQQARWGLQTTPVLARTAEPRSLSWTGSLALDPDQLVNVGCRFAPGEVIEIGKTEGAEPNRTLVVGDRVRKGQLLAVIHSPAVGEKKIELLNAQLTLYLDEEILDRARKSAEAVPELFILNAQRNVTTDQNAVARALNTLRSWNIPDAEIKAVLTEAEQVHKARAKRDPEKEKQWGRTELRAPMDGTILERNVALGEFVADGNVSLFRIGKLDRLLVMVQIAEGDLPILEALPPEQRRWTIRPGASDRPTAEVRIERLGYVVDPKTGTVVAAGHIDNADGRWRAGQFVIATMTLPQTTDEVIVPATSVIESEGRTFVFVQPDARQAVYEQRRVWVVRRGPDVVHIRSRLTAEQERQGFQPLRPGERAVTAKATELKALLDDLKQR